MPYRKGELVEREDDELTQAEPRLRAEEGLGRQTSGREPAATPAHGPRREPTLPLRTVSAGLQDRGGSLRLSHPLSGAL